jgi:hypothetical protein
MSFQPGSPSQISKNLPGKEISKESELILKYQEKGFHPAIPGKIYNMPVNSRNMFGFVKIFSICVAFIFINDIQAQHQVSNIFRKFRNDEGVKHFNLSGDVTKMLQTKDKKLQSKVEEMHVYLFSKNHNISGNDKIKIQKALASEKFELLIKTRDKNRYVSLHGKENAGFLTQLYAELKVDGLPVYMILSGKILLSEISDMNFNFEGSQALKNLPVP